MATYDPGILDELGARRAQLRAELAEVARLIEAEVPKAVGAGLIQADIARRLGMTRESVAQLCRPADQRWKQRAAKVDGADMDGQGIRRGDRS